jgi:hypothetical protein
MREMQVIGIGPSGSVGPIGRRTKREAGGERQRRPLDAALRPLVEAISRLAARREWILQLLGEERSAAILRGLAASADPDDTRLALSQLDRLPEWLDLLTTWLDQPQKEHLVLESLNGVSRLTGPYADLALRTYLHREAQRALRGDSPADYLWDLSLRVARWIGEWSSLGTIRLDPANPRFVLSGVPESLRGFARRIDSAGRVERDLNRLLQAWPDSAEVAPLPDEAAFWHRSRVGLPPADGASLPPKEAAGLSGAKMPRAA